MQYKNFVTYNPGPVTALKFKEVCVFDPQSAIHQHVQRGKLTL